MPTVNPLSPNTAYRLGVALTDLAGSGPEVVNAINNTDDGVGVIPLGASVLTVTDPRIVASTVVVAVLTGADATALHVKYITVTNGSFTIHTDGNATANVGVMWIARY
jgi:hypothetical protein